METVQNSQEATRSSISQSRNNLQKSVTFVIVILIILGVFFLVNYLQQNYVSDDSKSISSEQLPTSYNESISNPINVNLAGDADLNTDISDLYTDWSVYENEAAAISLKYPSEIPLNNYDAGGFSNSKLLLYITVRDMDTMTQAPMQPMDSQMARQDALDIKAGIVNTYDQSINGSEKIITLGHTGIKAKSFIVFSQFEVCNVQFTRRLVFYNNNQQITITMHTDTQALINENKDYFVKDELNCSGWYVWGSEELNNKNRFYNDISNGTIQNEYAREWYDTFDAIVSTISILK